MEDLNPSNLESKVEDLKKRIENLPDDYRCIGQKALELCQQENITLIDYKKQMSDIFPYLERATVQFNRKLMLTLLIAEDIVLHKETDLVYA